MDSSEATAVRAANGAFYTAHESQDFEAMARVWSHGHDVICIHPGWPILRGWAAVGESWRRILSGPGRNQFIRTNEQVNMTAGVAWVTLDENLMAAGGGTGTVAATNIFMRIDGEWKMVHHQGGPVASRAPVEPGDAG